MAVFKSQCCSLVFWISWDKHPPGVYDPSWLQKVNSLENASTFAWCNGLHRSLSLKTGLLILCSRRLLQREVQWLFHRERPSKVLNVCTKQAPTTTLEMSMYRVSGFCRSGGERSGNFARCSLWHSNADWHVINQQNFWPFLVSLIGAIILRNGEWNDDNNCISSEMILPPSQLKE